MAHSSDNASEKKITSPIARALCELNDEILQNWVKQVKQTIKCAAKLQAPIIINTIPVFLGNLAEAIDGNLNRNNANQNNNIAEEHGGERARITDYSPEHVVQEYSLLREIVTQKLRSRHQLSHEIESIIQRSFDEAIQKSMMAFHLSYNEMRGKVISYLTHDMRTPITAAKLSLDIILRKLEKESFESKNSIISLVQRANKNISYSNELIQNILDEKYLKTYIKSPELQFLEGEMMAIIRSAVEVYSDDNRGRIILTGDKVFGFWEIKSIRRVAENMITNAIKYGFEDTPIEIKVCSTNGRVLISFHNKGTPIPVEEKGLLFNNFTRSMSAEKGRKTGWGMGLSFCREVVEAHAGSLGLESSDDGTTFTIDIPVDPRGIEIKSR